MGAIRRVFARSDLRREILEGVRIVTHSDPKHPRVKHWSRCPKCQKIMPRYQFAIDHINPVIPLHMSAREMTIEQIVNAIFCDRSNLQPLCKQCHHEKTQAERKQRHLSKRNK